jgi:hypothetical protein
MGPVGTGSHLPAPGQTPAGSVPAAGSPGHRLCAGRRPLQAPDCGQCADTAARAGRAWLRGHRIPRTQASTQAPPGVLATLARAAAALPRGRRLRRLPAAHRRVLPTAATGRASALPSGRAQGGGVARQRSPIRTRSPRTRRRDRDSPFSDLLPASVLRSGDPHDAGARRSQLQRCLAPGPVPCLHASASTSRSKEGTRDGRPLGCARLTVPAR